MQSIFKFRFCFQVPPCPRTNGDYRVFRFGDYHSESLRLAGVISALNINCIGSNACRRYSLVLNILLL